MTSTQDDRWLLQRAVPIYGVVPVYNPIEILSTITPIVRRRSIVESSLSWPPRQAVVILRFDEWQTVNDDIM